MPRHNKMMVRRKSSRLRVLTICSSSLGTMNQAPRMIIPTMAADLASGPSRLTPATPSGLASNGVNSIMGTTTRSWKIRIPMVALPWGESASPRAAKALRTITVLLSARRQPQKIASWRGSPRNHPTPATSRRTAITWSGPPMSNRVRAAARFDNENSIPIVNSRSTMPISARTRTCSKSATRFSPCGPIMAPATRKPAIEGRRSLWNAKTTAMDTVKMTSRSFNTLWSVITTLSVCPPESGPLWFLGPWADDQR